MKKSSYFFIILVALVFVLTIYSLLCYWNMIQLPQRLLNLVFILIPFLFIGGVFIVGNNKGPEVFVQRFLMLTTFQFLATLAILLAVWYKMREQLKEFGIQFVVIFVVLLIIQSVLLIRSNKS